LSQRFAMCAAIELFEQGSIFLGDAHSAIFCCKGQRELDFGKYIKLPLWLPLWVMQLRKAANAYTFQKV